MPSNSITFTEDRLARLKPPATGRDVYRDTMSPLIVRVTSTGVKTYSIYKKMGGKPVRHTIGQVGKILLKDARAAAAVALGKIPLGVNPNVEKKQRAAKRVRITFGQLWDYYLEQHAKPHKKSWRDDEGRYKRHLETEWKDKPLDGIDQAAVEHLHTKVGVDAPYEANRLRALLHKMFSLAPKIGFKGPNPVHGIKRFKEHQRERFLQADELPTFFKALEQMRIDSPVVADALEVALWTGARRGNVMAMRWEELALQRAEWTIPAAKHKNGKQIVVHLPAPALEILVKRQETAGTSPWVFPGRRHGKHIQDPYKPWRALLEASGLKDLRPHDLRRTMGSWETATGANLQVVGKTLGHASLASTQVYARLNLDPVKAAVNKAVEAIEAARDRKADMSVKVASVAISHTVSPASQVPAV